MSDYRENQVYVDSNFKIMECQRRGHEPFYELHILKKFLWWKYWGFFKWSDEVANLKQFINRWESWK